MQNFDSLIVAYPTHRINAGSCAHHSISKAGELAGIN